MGKWGGSSRKKTKKEEILRAVNGDLVGEMGDRVGRVR